MPVGFWSAEPSLAYGKRFCCFRGRSPSQPPAREWQLLSLRLLALIAVPSLGISFLHFRGGLLLRRWVGRQPEPECDPTPELANRSPGLRVTGGPEGSARWGVGAWAPAGEEQKGFVPRSIPAIHHLKAELILFRNSLKAGKGCGFQRAGLCFVIRKIQRKCPLPKRKQQRSST